MGDASVNRRHGDARAHATSAAIRPDLSEHTVQLVYHGAVRKLYVYLDGEPSPLLAADVDLADADAGSLDARPAHFGFTARANRALAVAVRDVRVSEPTAAPEDTKVLQEGQSVAAAGGRARLHLDARDGCGAPLLRGGLRWSVALRAAGSAEAPAPDAAARIVDEGDGVYEVTLAAPAAAGAYDVMVAAADADATAPPPALASAGVVYVT